ncbi:MAG: hypothetical protein AAGG68_14145 [Bacteroidota bacterium]
MRSQLLSFILLLFVSVVLSAQTRPSFLPDQIETPSTLEIQTLCKPGVKNKSRSRGLEISYHYLDGSTFREETEEPFPNEEARTQALTNTTFKIKIPIINRPGFNLLLGYNRERENYKFEELGSQHPIFYETLDQNIFKSNNYSLIVSKSLDDKHYLGFNARVLYNGNYSGWSTSNNLYQHFSLIGVYGFKLNEDFEWGFGLSYSKDLEQQQRLIPFLVYNKNFSDRWGIEAVLPVSVQLRHNINRGNILLFGANYTNQSYGMNNILNNVGDFYVINHAEVRGSISWEAKLMPWIWLNVKAGYQYNFDTEMLNVNNSEASIIYDPTNSLFFRIGIFVSPPDSFVK